MSSLRACISLSKIVEQSNHIEPSRQGEKFGLMSLYGANNLICFIHMKQILLVALSIPAQDQCVVNHLT
jgi:hypothetical protein